MSIADEPIAPPQSGGARSRARLRPYQGAIGLTLCAIVVCAWLTVHVAAVFFLEITWANLPLVPVIAALQCWLSVGLFIIAHDAMHGSLAPGRPNVNTRIGAFILFIYAGFAWRRVRAAHMAHHRAPGTPEDPDFYADDPENFGPWFATFFSRYFGARSIVFVATVVTTYLLVLGAPVLNVVAVYGLPSLASAVQLFYFGTYLPHRHEEAEETFADRHNTRSNEYGYLASLLSCFHFGYHHEHHDATWVPWWALPHERPQNAVAG